MTYVLDEEDYFAHYGILRKSGRYPWGSGEDQNARNKSFLDYVEGLRKQGLSETDIAKGFGITTTELRAAKSIAKTEQRQADIGMAQRLKDKGYSNVAIGERMGLNESSVRALLAPGLKDRADVLQTTSKMLKEAVAEKKYVDIGSGVENHLGVSSTKLSTAVAMLREEGYTVHYVKVPQLGTGKNTTVKVLAGPDVSYPEVYKNRNDIQQISSYSTDGGRTSLGIKPPLSINSKRVAVKYAEEGGTDADGVIYVRPGVKDLSLGQAKYAQVRIAVDGTHYLKGMAMYRDDLPDGVDLMFNTNKSSTGNKLDAMKKMKDDPDNPFGSTVRQLVDPKTGKVTSALNIVNEEGDWSGWSKTLSTQVLSKQPTALAKRQLELALAARKQDLEEISKLTNPAVKKRLLESYADDADSASVHLKAAAMPRQASHVILPINSIKETEIYAPNYKDGEQVVLIRYPHGGIFEIPQLTVNNRHPEAKQLLGNARDAVGINHKVAERLSGADFDGDTVLVIPNNKGDIKTAPALAGLKGFDPQAAYPAYHGMKTMGGGTWDANLRKDVYPEGKSPSGRVKGIEMGKVSNLITDMTIRGASAGELARAVRHSMVVIDAEKHALNWRESAKVNGIEELKKKYQPNTKGGASTLISRASSEVRVADRKPRSAANGGPIDKATGKKMYELTGEEYVDRSGNIQKKTIKSKKLAETEDANSISSGTPVEKIYADYSNNLKAIANEARRISVNTSPTPYSPSAKKVYAKEVESLNAKLNLALRNRPLERQAQVVANAVIAAKKQANPDMDHAELKKLKGQALTEARHRVGAEKQKIEITPSEWQAIQAGAITFNKLSTILSNTDLDKIRQLATPRTSVALPKASVARAKLMLNAGHTQAEVAEALGVSVTTLQKSVNGDSVD